MKCNSCNIEWTDTEKFANIKKCPFCGEALFANGPSKSLSTMGDVLKTILEKYGENIFRDKTRLLNIYRDLAPNLQKESFILESAMVNHIEKYFIGVKPEERELNIRKIRSDMSYVMSSEAIETVISSFSQVFGWQYTAINNISATTSDIPLKTSANRSLKELQTAAKRGDASAMCELGMMYQEGNGVRQDDDESYKWLKKSALLGNNEGQFEIGKCYHLGIGVGVNYAEAKKWYEKSANQGNMKAQCHLGLMDYNGTGVQKDYSKAKMWLEKSAQQGDPIPMFNLGLMYHNGDGVLQDFKIAFNYFTKAAEKNNDGAQYALGFMYYYGNGVRSDKELGLKWIRKSASQGYKHAEEFLDSHK